MHTLKRMERYRTALRELKNAISAKTEDVLNIITKTSQLLGLLENTLEQASREMETLMSEKKDLENRWIAADKELVGTKECIAELLETLCSGAPMGEPLTPELEKLSHLLRENGVNFSDRAVLLVKMS